MEKKIESSEIITISPDYFEENGKTVVFPPQKCVNEANCYEARYGVQSYTFDAEYERALPATLIKVIKKFGLFAFILTSSRLDWSTGTMRPVTKRVYICKGPITFNRCVKYYSGVGLEDYNHRYICDLYNQEFVCVSPPGEYVAVKSNASQERLDTLELLIYRRMT